MNHITSAERPKTWSRRANAPYYRERYALEVRHVLDDMMLSASLGDRESRVVKYADYPEISHVTLYLKINQAMLYLIDKLDTPDKTYANFREMISISRIRSVGIKFTFVAGEDKPMNALRISSPAIPTPTSIELQSKESTPPSKVNWKEQLLAFIDKAEVGQNLKINNLSLTMEDGEFIKSSVPEDKCIIYKASADSLFAAKLSAEQYAKTK